MSPSHKCFISQGSITEVEPFGMLYNKGSIIEIRPLLNVGVKTLKIVLMAWILLHVWKSTLNSDALNVSAIFYRHRMLDFLGKILLFDILGRWSVKLKTEPCISFKYLRM